MDTHKKIREHISAFADGTLCNIDRELAMAALQTADGRQTWQLYHRIGDVLRSAAVPELSPAFSDRLAARLDQEPPPLRRNARAGARTATAALLLPAGQGSAGAGVTATVPATVPETVPEAMAVSQAKPAIVSVS